MKSTFMMLALAGLCSTALSAQIKLNLNKAASAAAKGVKSLTLSDSEVIQYAKEYMEYSDKQNPVCRATDSDAGKKEVAERLERIVSAIPADLVKALNLYIVPYYVKDINAFACASGDIRVFAGLMEQMTDDEVLAVVGHEIGHVANKDSKDAFVAALRMSALKDAASAAGGKAAALSNSQLGDLAEALGKAQYSQKQEGQADAYGYDLLKKIGKDPASMAMSLGVLLKLQEEAGQSGNSQLQKLFSSHPDLKKRIEALDKR